MMKTATKEDRTKIISVWLDATSDDHGWVVDTDIMDGGESNTVRMFPPTSAGQKRAVKFALTLGTKKGLPVYRDDDEGRRELIQDVEAE